MSIKHRKNILIIAPLFITAVILMFLNTGSITRGQEQEDGCYCDENLAYDSDTVYEKVDCAQCKCTDSGKKIIRFQGLDSNCEDLATEGERMACYNEFSQGDFECSYVEECESRPTAEAKEDCYRACRDKYDGPSYDYSHGSAGTLVVTKSMEVGGSRTYFTGFDNDGKHKILTGFTGLGSEALTFYESSRDVEIGGIATLGNILTLESPYAGIYFGAYPEYLPGRMEVTRNTSSGATTEVINYHQMTTADRGAGLVMSNYGDDLDDLLLNTNNHTVLRINHTSAIGEKGVEVNGNIKASGIKFQGYDTKWTEKLIDGHFVLYY